VALTRYEDDPPNYKDMSDARLRFCREMGQKHNPLDVRPLEQKRPLPPSGVARFKVDYGEREGKIEDTAVSSDAPEWFQPAAVPNTEKSMYCGNYYTSHRERVHGHASRRYQAQPEHYDLTAHRHPWASHKDTELHEVEQQERAGHLQRAMQQPRFQQELRAKRPISARPSRKPGGPEQDLTANYSPLTHRFHWDHTQERAASLLKQDQHQRECLSKQFFQPIRNVNILSGEQRVDSGNVELNSFKRSEYCS